MVWLGGGCLGPDPGGGWGSDGGGCLGPDPRGRLGGLARGVCVQAHTQQGGQDQHLGGCPGPHPAGWPRPTPGGCLGPDPRGRLGGLARGVCVQAQGGVSQHALGQTPLPADGYCCGWYASYWNAFLLELYSALTLLVTCHLKKTHFGSDYDVGHESSLATRCLLHNYSIIISAI